MNEPAEKNHLLTDVLAESEPLDFRASLLGETLRLVRRRRHLRYTRRVATLVAALGVLAVFAWRRAPHTAPLPLATHYELVRTQALPTTAVIATQPFGAERLVASFTSAATLHTPLDRTLVPTINDRELLAFAAPRPAALVRVGPNAQALIFPDANTDGDSL